MKIIKSNIIYSIDKDTLRTIENGYIGYENSKVVFAEDSLPKEYSDAEVLDYSDNLLIPGFVDMHTHAPQFENIGLGMDKPLLDWLNQYTFPTEAKYADGSYAREMYKECIKRVIKNGTTRVCFYGTIHKQSCQILVEEMNAAGLKGYVGKINMDMNCPDDLMEDTGQSIEDTKAFYEANKDNADVHPIITPRFAVSCSEQCLKGLGEIAKQYDVPIQSHINESKREIAFVAELFPEYKSYADVYDKNNLLNDKTLMAHCIHMSEDDISLFLERGVWAIHCPQSNSNLSSGTMPLKNMMARGVKIGLGTDVSGGNDTSIIKTMLSAMQLSRIRHSQDNDEEILTVKEAFYLATKSGGRYFGKVGTFEPGYEFDALIINDQILSAKRGLSLKQRLERLIFCGDSRNIVKRFISGTEVDV